MQPLRCSIALIVGACSACAPRVVFQFAPQPGTTLVERFERELDLATVEQRFRFEAGGDDESPSACPPTEPSTWHEERHARFRERIAELRDGRAVRIARSIEQLDAALLLSTDPSSWSSLPSISRHASSPLVGKTIEFTRSADPGGFSAIADPWYSVSQVELRRLDARTDLFEFLPAHPVRVGDHWSVDAAEFGLLWDLGGAIPFDASDATAAPRFLERDLLRSLRGRIDVSLAALEHADDGEVAVLRLTGSLHGSNGPFEREGLVGTIAGPTEGNLRATTDATIELSGEIRWDSRRNHVRSLRVSAPVRVESEIDSIVESDVSFTTRSYFDWNGTLCCTLDVEEAK